MYLKFISCVFLMLSFGFCHVAAAEDYAAYLFVYFTGNDKAEEAVRYALSDDGFNFKALNGNRPVIDSRVISETGGVRDPHILRSEDGKRFFMVVTDMVSANGWDSNRGMTLLRSDDLVHWDASNINIQRRYEGQDSLKRVWAPQTVFDHKAGKYMVYWSMKHGDGPDIIYYAYANDDFTDLEGEPKVLFMPKDGLPCIDGDIVFRNGVYHLFYKTEGHGNGIKKATTRDLTSGKWKERDDYKQQTDKAVEGAGTFKLIGQDRYILMYDVYIDGEYQFTESSDLEKFHVVDEKVSMDFMPRHGTVIPITAAEKERLLKRWGGEGRTGFTYNGNPLIRHKNTADPAVMVVGDSLWLFTGYDEPGNKEGYHMPNWCAFATGDLIDWTEFPVPVRADDFKWNDAHVSFAGHPVQGPDGKFYFFSSTNWCGIGVARADRPEGPYTDVLGRPLLTAKDNCRESTHSWACIDPMVFRDDDGQYYIVWGNRECYMAKLKPSMTEIDGEVRRVPLRNFTEAPYIHKHGGKYYLTYAAEWPEKIAYAMADSIGGPWEYKGIISEIAGNSNTTHPAVATFKGRDWFFSHTGGLDGGSFSRSVIIEPLYYNEDGTIRPIPATAAGASVEYTGLDNRHNPVLPDFHADPEILFSNKTGKYYIYSTTDGAPGWGGHYFRVFSSGNLADWTDEGIMLDLKGSAVPWASGNAWAPAIIERADGDGGYKYYFYYSGHSPELDRKVIGVAVSDNPAGPFYDLGRPIVTDSPVGHGQQIDVDVFEDPASGKFYLYWGNGYMAGAELNDDMTSIKEETLTVMTPQGGTLEDYAYREAPYVFYRNGKYYFMWSVDDTGSPNYHVAYGTADSPLGEIKVAEKPVVLRQDARKGIYGPAHNSVINIPGTDEWRIVYHRINKDFINDKPGIHRQVCIDRMRFNEDGTIAPVQPTL